MARIGRILNTAPTVFQTDSPVVSGDSGGPVFDLNGKVIGINSRIQPSLKGNFHVPIDVFTENLGPPRPRRCVVEATPVACNRDSEPVRGAFRDVIVEASRCVVNVKCDGADATLGTIVGPDGWVLTKASQLHGKIVCNLRDKREFEARIVGIEPTYDLAMLKIEATDLPAIPWSKQEGSVGQWVATPGMTDLPVGVGILSVPVRAIPPLTGQLGVMMDEKKSDATIKQVMPGALPSKPA